ASDERRVNGFDPCPRPVFLQTHAHQFTDAICQAVENIVVTTQALGRVIETADPIACQETFARAVGDCVKAGLVVEKSLLRGFGATRGETTVCQCGRVLRNIFAGGRRSCIQRNCSASVEPSKAAVELLPSAIICATRSK